MRVQNDARGTFYRCNTSNRDQHGRPHHVNSANVLDNAVLAKMQALLNDPAIIGAEVDRLRRDDPTAADRKASERRLAELERQRGNIARSIGAIDDDDAAAYLLAELASLSKQATALIDEREELDCERRSWEAAQQRLDDLQAWRRVVSRNLSLLDHDGRRLALDALDVEVRVWPTNHHPRYEIRMALDAQPVVVSDFPTEADGDPDGAHVDGYTRRGCARRGGRHAGRL